MGGRFSGGENWDALLQKPIGKMRRAELWKAYGMAAYALSARVLSKREAEAALEDRT
jgi:hypothetical protein